MALAEGSSMQKNVRRASVLSNCVVAIHGEFAAMMTKLQRSKKLCSRRAE
jgi:hypothetical protein